MQTLTSIDDLSHSELIDFYKLWLLDQIKDSNYEQVHSNTVMRFDDEEDAISAVTEILAKKIQNDEFEDETKRDFLLEQRILFLVSQKHLYIASRKIRSQMKEENLDKIDAEVVSFFESQGLHRTGLRTKEEIVSDFDNSDVDLASRHYAQPAEAPEIEPVTRAISEGKLDVDQRFPTVAIKSGGTNLQTIYGENSLGGKFEIAGDAHQELTNDNRISKDSNEFWGLFVSDDVIDWMQSMAADHDAIPIGFTPAFPVKYDEESGDYCIVHCSGKHVVPNFAPANESSAENFDRSKQKGIIASLQEFFAHKGLDNEVIQKIDINVCPNDTFAASGMVANGGMIVGTGWNISLGDINMEFGQYRGFEPSTLDYVVAQEIGDPNINLEWLTSGKYMYQYLRAAVRMILGPEHPLNTVLGDSLSNKQINIIIADLAYDDDFDLDKFVGSSISISKTETALLKSVSTQIMDRSVDAVSESLTASVAIYESKGKPAKEQYVFGTDGSIALKTPGFVQHVNNRLKELDSRITIDPFDSDDVSVDLSGGEEEITLDATANGTANYAVAAHQCKELGLGT